MKKYASQPAKAQIASYNVEQEVRMRDRNITKAENPKKLWESFFHKKNQTPLSVTLVYKSLFLIQIILNSRSKEKANMVRRVDTVGTKDYYKTNMTFFKWAWKMSLPKSALSRMQNRLCSWKKYVTNSRSKNQCCNLMQQSLQNNSWSCHKGRLISNVHKLFEVPLVNVCT